MLKTFFLFLVVLASAGFWLWNEPDTAGRFRSDIQDAGEKVAEAIVAKVKGEVLLSSPLVAGKEVTGDPLTHDGVFSETNIARIHNSPLTNFGGNTALDRIAALRLQDMFDKQYFEHFNPQGEGAADVAKVVGYGYVSIGENIALGNFGSDKAVVEAWMNSPGHRANILNTKFTELGMAVKQEMYKGRSAWIGVQIFGKPLNACPAINESLKDTITMYQNVLLVVREQADVLAAELKATEPHSREEREAYNRKVDQYNTVASEINKTVTSLKTLVAEYNAQVQAFNACVKG